MIPPPSHFQERRARRRAQLRRRRLLALAAGVGVAALTAVVVAGLGSGGTRGGARAASSGAATGTLSSGRGAGRSRRVSRRSTAAASASGQATIRRLAALGLPIYCAGHRGNAVAFTFDDGPGPYTHYALRKLTEAHQRATFFVVGKSMNAYPGYLPRELKVAAIGDHTYTHPFLPALSPAAITSEIARTKQQIEAESGQAVEFFRPPYGSRTQAIDAIARRLGLLEILWSVDSADSLGANYAGITTNVEAGLYPGSIILMHENRGQTIRALTAILPELARRHLRSVSLPELFATDPPSEAQVHRGPAGCRATRSSSLTTGT
jgi:peptidoglycan/xylan/chitin deacetylase (PgdA/CDA1 family)